MSHQLAWLSFSTWHLTWEREPTSSYKSQHILTLAVSCPGSRVQSWDPGLLKQLLLPEAMQLEVVMQRSIERRVILPVVMPSVSREQWSWWPEVGSRCVWTAVVPQHSNPFTFSYILFLRKFSLCTIGRICAAFGRLMLPPEWAFSAFKKRLFLPYFNILLFLFIGMNFCSFKIFPYLFMYLFVYCVYIVCLSMICICSSQKGVLDPGNAVISGFKLPSVGAQNPTWVLCRAANVLSC